jgi:hypothetical protein
MASRPRGSNQSPGATRLGGEVPVFIVEHSKGVPGLRLEHETGREAAVSRGTGGSSRWTGPRRRLERRF